MSPPPRPLQRLSCRPVRVSGLTLGYITLLLLSLFSSLNNKHLTSAYRQTNTASSDDDFVPYETGFVGKTNDPSNYLRERVNEGSANTQAFPRLHEFSTGNQICPNMVGPLADDKYYCGAKEFGYCDRRSGACFCNIGYQGVDCAECSPTHIQHGGLCYPKIFCPDDCSGSGTCDYLTGLCDCVPHRNGDNCANLVCTDFDSLCTDCTFDANVSPTPICLKCMEGYSVHPTTSVCQECTRFDPRCRTCSATECLACADPLLTSIRRSGARETDSTLPFDELARELSILVPFGSLQPNAFDEAEPFALQGTSPSGTVHTPHGTLPATTPLKDHTKSCSQGDNTNAASSSWTCTPAPTSHSVCGHPGTFSFSSPEYTTLESSNTLRIAIRRTGGGVEQTTLDYNLHHITSNDTYVTSTHFYTTTQTLTFAPGEIEKSFLVTIHDDRAFDYADVNRRFLLTLSNPTNGAALGPQHRSIITIIDDDRDYTSSYNSYTFSPGLAHSLLTSAYNEKGTEYKEKTTTYNVAMHKRGIAGTSNEFTIKAMSCTNAAQSAGGDEFLVEIREARFKGGASEYTAAVDLTNSPSTTSTPITARHSAPTHGHRRALPSPVRGTVTDNNDGSYSTTLTTTIAGKYDMHTYLVIPGGLMGHYFDDAYFSPSHLVKTRVDKTLNFDWGDGRITTHGSDFVSVYWDGRIKVAASESYTFMIEFDDNVRLFIDGVLLVDKWDRAPYTASATVDLVAGTYHEILLEYREIRNDAHLHLFWESPTVAKELVPSTNLFYTEDVNGSPANYTVIASTPDGAKTTAKGLGLHAGTAGQEHKFTIESRDAFGNWRGDFDIGYGGTAAYYDKVLKDSARMDGFAAVATLITDNGGDGKGSDKVPVTIEFNPLTHLFDSTFTPHLSGDYRLDVALTDELLGNYVEDLDTVAAADHIFGSPFSVSVAPALTFALHSDVYGGNGNCPGSAGLYDTTGAYGDTWASWSAASCSGINHGMTGTEQYFYINSRDVHHNNRHAHGDSWEVVAHSLDGKIAFEGTAVPTATAGEYIAKVTPETEGQYYLDVTLDGVHAKGSPFKLYVRHNDAASNSYIIDAASLAYATTSGHPTNNIFYVQLVDANDNKLQSHSTPYTTSVSATITSDAANAVVDETAAIQMMGDGTVKVTHTPTTIGANKLNIVVNGAHIKGSPFEINVLPGAVVGATGTATGGGLSASVAGQVAEFIVQSRDLESNPRDSSTDSYTVLLTMASLAARPANYDTMVDNSWGSTASVTGVVEYIGNGQYKCTYNATVAGTYDLDVQIGGTHIVGSPFSPVIAPTVASGTESDVHGTGTRTGTAGATALVEVYLRDVFENYLLAAGDLVKCVAELTSTHQVAWQEVAGGGSYIVNGVAAADLIGEVENVYKVDIAPVSLGNSQYSCDYVPAYSGDYAVKAFLETPGGLFGSYYRTDNFAPSKLSLVRHDLEIDFDWGQYSAVAGVSDPGIVCSGSTGLPDDPLTPAFDESKCAGNGLAMPLDHFSVVWEGFVEAEHDEEYEIGVVCDSNSDVGVWVGGIEVVSYGPCGGAEQGEKSGKVLMQAGVRASIEVKYSHATRESSIGLRWTSPSQGPWGTIGKDRLFRDIQIDPASTYEPAYAPSAAASAFSTVIGPAAYEAVAGVTQTFVVECRDAFGGGVYGNLQLAGGGCQVAAVGRGASGNAAEAAFEGAVTDNGDGTYTVTYQPEHSGSYYLSVTAVVAGDDVDVGWYHYDLSTASSHVVGSPFILQVEPGEVVALESHVDVEVVDDAIVGQESQVVVWSRDVWANRRLVGGNSFEVFLAESGVGDTFGHVDGDKNVYAAVVDNGDGTYTASFTPGAQSEVTGDWELRVFLTTAGSGREECKGSPYGLVVWPNTPVASESYIKSGESSKVKRGELEGGGSREELIEFAASTGSLRTWYVQAADVSKNDWWIGGSSFVARVRGEQDESDENKRLAVVDVGDGRYRVDMTLEVAGDYEIDIGLAGEAGKVGKAGGGVEQVSGGGGLLGRYFNNQHLKGTPEFERVDKVVDFSWGHGYVTNSAVDFVSVEWTGWIKCPNSEEVVFELANVDDYARLYIEDVLVVDTSTGVGAGGWVAKEGMLYKVRVEFFETQGEAGVGLYWSSMSMQRHIVPSVWLFSYLEAIQGSPFKLTVA